MQILFQYELVTIKYDKPNNLLNLNWEGYITSEDYIMIMREMLQFTHKLKIECWLSDASRSDDIQMGDMSWTINHMADFLKGTCLRKIARVVRDNTPSQKNIEKLLESDRFQQQQKVAFRIFKNYDEAFYWLTVTQLKQVN